MGERSLADLLAALGSSAPTPGGGAAAAIAGAMGAALVEMAANLTVGKRRFAEVEADARRVRDEARHIRAQLLALADADTRAFGQVSAAYKLPASTDAERTARVAAIQAALALAAEPPLAVAGQAAAALRVSELAVDVVNPAVVSDVMTGAALLHGALIGAGVNVEVNVAALRDEVGARRLATSLAQAREGADLRLAMVLSRGRERMA